MKDETFDILQKEKLDYSDFEVVENIFAHNMIYNKDEMIIEILKHFQKEYGF